MIGLTEKQAVEKLEVNKREIKQTEQDGAKKILVAYFHGQTMPYRVILTL